MFRSYLILFFLLGILSNFVSYSEELILAMLYIILFIIFSEQTRDTIKKILINKNVNMMLIYEQLVYLKEKILKKNNMKKKRKKNE